MLLVLLAGVLSGSKCRAAAPVPPEALVLAEKVHQPVFDLARDVVAVPKHAADILRLPFGLVETVLCPLPALEFTDGVGNVGRGIKAIPEFVYSVLKLPASVVSKGAKITKGAGAL